MRLVIGSIPLLQKYLAIGNRGYKTVREAFPKGRPPARTVLKPAQVVTELVEVRV